MILSSPLQAIRYPTASATRFYTGFNYAIGLMDVNMWFFKTRKHFQTINDALEAANNSFKNIQNISNSNRVKKNLKRSFRHCSLAIAQFDDANTPAEDLAQLYRMRGMVSRELGRASSHNSSIIRWYKTAIYNFRSAVDLNPRDVFALKQLGNSYYALTQYHQALDCYHQLIRIDANEKANVVNLMDICQRKCNPKCA